VDLTGNNNLEELELGPNCVQNARDIPKILIRPFTKISKVENIWKEIMQNFVKDKRGKCASRSPKLLPADPNIAS
jgi:hypothetical protein